tara:strand:- start:1365 stop:1766 length:402 start_codon:yes stop_codon:yes gene_type:complete
MRKLKPIVLRKPKDVVPHDEILKSIADSTGFTKTDIETVIDEYLSLLRCELLERKMVKLRNIGSIYPVVHPPRLVTNMGGRDGRVDKKSNYDRFLTEPRWNIKFQLENGLAKDVKDIMVTKRDLDNIYYKEKK